jgi:hypothetical protein
VLRGLTLHVVTALPERDGAGQADKVSRYDSGPWRPFYAVAASSREILYSSRTNPLSQENGLAYNLIPSNTNVQYESFLFGLRKTFSANSCSAADSRAEGFRSAISRASTHQDRRPTKGATISINSMGEGLVVSQSLAPDEPLDERAEPFRARSLI